MKSATGNRKPLLVGEAPSRTSDPDRPFSGRSGDRLQKLMRCPLEDVFCLRNVYTAWPGPGREKGSYFDVAAARASAASIFHEAVLDELDLLLVGKRVSSAFQIKLDYLVWWKPILGVRVAVLPHPSGIVRWWNDPVHEELARSFLNAIRFPR